MKQCLNFKRKNRREENVDVPNNRTCRQAQSRKVGTGNDTRVKAVAYFRFVSTVGSDHLELVIRGERATDGKGITPTISKLSLSLSLCLSLIIPLLGWLLYSTP